MSILLVIGQSDRRWPSVATNVDLTDLLPAGLTPTANNGGITQGTYDPVTGLFTIGTLQVGQTATLTLEGTVDAGQGGNTITNVTTAATGDQADPSTVGDDLDESVAVNVPLVVDAEVAIAKEVFGEPTLLANGNFDVLYQLVVENTGNVDLANLSILEDFRNEFGSAAIRGKDIVLITPPSDPASTITTNLDLVNDVEIINQNSPSLLASGDSFVVQFVIEVDPDNGGAPLTLNNQVVITGDAVDSNGDPILDASGDPVMVTDLSDSGSVADSTNPGADGDTGGSDDPTPLIFPAADLVTVKSLSSGDATPDEGDTVTFQIVVTNNGELDATGVFLTDFLPPGLTATGNNGVTSQGSYDAVSGIFGIGDIPVGGTATLILEGTVDVGQGGNTITNITTAATGDQLDSSLAGDDLEESVVVNVNDAADLVTVKTLASGDATPAEGDTVVFQIDVTNNGGAQATNVTLTDSLPAGFTLTGDTTTQGTYVNGVWNIGTLNVGDTVTITLTGTIDAGTAGSTITNVTTAATGDQMDPSTVGDDLVESVVVEDNTTDLVTVKTLASGDATPDEGDTVIFQIVVSNNGPDTATGISLTDSLPAGLTFVADTVTQGTCLLYTSPSPRDRTRSRMPSSA